MTPFDGKTALTAGAARGTGRAFAGSRVAEGARAALADIDIARARQSAEGIGPAAIAVAVDIARQDIIRAGVANAIASGVVDCEHWDGVDAFVASMKSTSSGRRRGKSAQACPAGAWVGPKTSPAWRSSPPSTRPIASSPRPATLMVDRG